MNCFTYRAPGQANSYFYGYTRLISLREETEKALSAKHVKFDQKKFHDFILAQGLLPPDMMRKAVLEGFVLVFRHRSETSHPELSLHQRLWRWGLCSLLDGTPFRLTHRLSGVPARSDPSLRL